MRIYFAVLRAILRSRCRHFHNAAIESLPIRIVTLLQERLNALSVLDCCP